MTRSSLLSAKRLIEPDVWTCPHGKRIRPQTVETFGPEVAAVCAEAGYAPDPQQELILDLTFAIRPDGSPASFEICVICCRQNLKTGALKQIAIGWVYVLDEPEVVWSAHEMSTTLDAQDDLANLIRNSPTLRKRMLPQRNEGIYTDNGSERIELLDPATGLKQTFMFKARTATGGRGLARKKLILDEAFALTPRMLGSLIPIMLAMEGPQVVYASSPGAVDAKTLHDIRARGTAGTTPMMTYVEWNAPRTECEDPACDHPKNGDEACALNRPALYAKANPAVSTGRITLERIANTRQTLSAEEFMRECLGWWDEDDQSSGVPALDLREWKRRTAKDTPAPTRAAAVVQVARDRSRTSIGVVGAAPDGKVLMMLRTVPGAAGVIDQLRKLEANIDLAEVALHPSGATGALVPALTKAGFEIQPLTHQDQGRGCSAVQMAVVEKRLVHLGQTELNNTAAIARTRTTPAGVEVWDQRDTEVDISPIVAASTALYRWDLLNAEPQDTPPSRPRRVSSGTGSTTRTTSIADVGF